MFERNQKTQILEQKSTPFKPPIVVLDVDETLILGNDPQGNPIDTLNHRLIDTLVRAGVKEAYLLTAFELKMLKTKEEREEVPQLLRLDVIKHLAEKGITVKAVVSNHDIVDSALKAEDEITPTYNENNWISTALPGNYYNTVIKPQEEKVKGNPDINLNEDKEYQKTIIQQRDNSKFIYNIQGLYELKNIKSPLADLLFASLKKEGVFSDGEPRTVLFFDDKIEYINSVSLIAKKYNMKIDCLQIKKPYEQDYSAFISVHYPLLEYQEMVSAINSELEALKDQVSQALPKFLLFGKSKYSVTLVTPMEQVLEVFSNVRKDMKSNLSKHDCVGASNAMIKELIKRQKEIESNINKLPAKEQSIANAITVGFGVASDRLGKMLSSLAIFYNVQYKAGARKDVSMRPVGL